ncbi:cytosol nonspecific dipeptidase, partial [Klebsiella pneumoniae]|nr:cytosol nonspecific dipeptidase [Klebsiella pneumoniae]
LIKKKGNKESNNPIILQAHIDMVCVKRENSNHNFNTDPIDVIRDGDIIFAKDTSLGADQGIGLAIMLLILESDTI